MAEEAKLFKHLMFQPAFFEELNKALAAELPTFDREGFMASVFDEGWKNRELKQRIRHLTTALNQILPADFAEAAGMICGLAKHLRRRPAEVPSFGFMCLAEYLELYGLDHFKPSVKAMEEVTRLISCEFAVRPFIIRYPERMMKQMQNWAHSQDPKLRRLASEGCRPRLPWGQALAAFKANPSPVLEILEILKEDEDVWVRKSVANNLNDISKDHPELLIRLIRKWKGTHPHTDWILKHASRTLLKQGNREVMSVFGFRRPRGIAVQGFRVETPVVANGSDLEFSFSLTNQAAKAAVVRVEYAIHYLNGRGNHFRKVFKLSEREYGANSSVPITRKHSFRPITTRRYYPGQHGVSLILNGIEVEKSLFELRP